jgi:protein phosphatase
LLFLDPFGVSDAGKVRRNNEDAYLAGEGRDETLLAIADGIGGFEAGEVASRIAIEALRELEPDAPFETAIREANRRILTFGRGDERLSGMGTTIVAVRFGGTRERPVAEVAHVGDSRAYLLRGGNLRPLTEDHSLVAELVRSGELTRDQAAEHPQKNLITRALGAVSPTWSRRAGSRRSWPTP